MDFYRLGKKAEIMDLGWEDYLGQGIIIIEWAEKMKFNLDAIYVTFSIEENETRRILIS